MDNQGMIETLQSELQSLERENTQLRGSLAKLQDTLDDWRAMAAIKQAQAVEEMTSPDTVSVSFWRLKIANGGYQVVRMAAIVGGYLDGKPEVLAAFNEHGEQAPLSREEEIVALCHACGGWYQPPKHTDDCED